MKMDPMGYVDLEGRLDLLRALGNLTQRIEFLEGRLAGPIHIRAQRSCKRRLKLALSAYKALAKLTNLDTLDTELQRR